MSGGLADVVVDRHEDELVGVHSSSGSDRAAGSVCDRATSGPHPHQEVCGHGGFRRRRARGAAARRGIAAATPTSRTVKAFMTLYGYADNSPPGRAIAHPCIHTGAGGTGTFKDPITFATDVREVGWCKKIYVPYMKRYFIHEDECAECDHDWATVHRYRFDMWAGGDAARGRTRNAPPCSRARTSGPAGTRSRIRRTRSSGSIRRPTLWSRRRASSRRRSRAGTGSSYRS